MLSCFYHYVASFYSFLALSSTLRRRRPSRSRLPPRQCSLLPRQRSLLCGQKVNRGSKVYVGLRIPNPDSASRQNIDLVLVHSQEVVVIPVKNVSGSVSIDEEGNWVCSDGVKLSVVFPILSSHSASFPPEVISLDWWTKLKFEERNSNPGWIKSPLGAKKKIQESFHEKLNSVLSSAPVCGIEIKGNKHILGDFIEFKGNSADIQAS